MYATSSYVTYVMSASESTYEAIAMAGYLYVVIIIMGRVIAEAVSRWLPTAAARVRARVWQVGFVVTK
jgi:hypothetical protein